MAHTGFKVIQIDGINYREYTTGTIAFIPPPKSDFVMYPKSPCIYKVTDKHTGKLYIGSTVNMFKRIRGYNNGKDLKKGVFSGYSYNDIIVEVIEDCTDKTIQERLLLEYKYIIELNTIFPNGNNISCPVTNIKFSLLDLSTYNPLIKPVFPNKTYKYNKEKYEANKEHISELRRLRRLKKKLG